MTDAIAIATAEAEAEFEAMRIIEAALRNLNAEAQARVLRYVADRLNVKLPGVIPDA